MHASIRSKVFFFVSLVVISSACLAFGITAKAGVQAAGTHISLSPNTGHPSASINVIGKAFGVSEVVLSMRRYTT